MSKLENLKLQAAISESSKVLESYEQQLRRTVDIEKVLGGEEEKLKIPWAWCSR